MDYLILNGSVRMAPDDWVVIWLNVLDWHSELNNTQFAWLYGLLFIESGTRLYNRDSRCCIDWHRINGIGQPCVHNTGLMCWNWLQLDWMALDWLAWIDYTLIKWYLIDWFGWMTPDSMTLKSDLIGLYWRAVCFDLNWITPDWLALDWLTCVKLTGMNNHLAE